MKDFNFDTIIARKNTHSVKYDGMKVEYGREDLLSLWVADMDFATPSFIIDAIRNRCEHPILGYTFAPDSYYTTIMHWIKQLYDYEIQREWLAYIPGIVKGISFCIQCFTKPGDKIIIQPPVYHPFRRMPTMQNRIVVDNPLRLVDGCYEMDFNHLESIIDSDCKMFILCNPHNPGGVVWSKDTLIHLAEICYEKGILVVSDEIHAEMVYSKYKHHPFASISEIAKQNSITLMAPSKTFNMAGIVSSYTIVPNETLRKTFFHYLETSELNSAHLFAYVATEAAYKYGMKWRNEMLSYVEENIAFVERYLASHIKQIKVYPTQASFLVWLDCRALNISQKELVSLFVDEAKLALNDGSMFGIEGTGYMRLNIGCPRSILQKALNNLKIAVERK